ncbi:MAG TPA: DUF6662 family protein [Candidatus Udaeobacter sp.]|nr:DUF6662 family protein [Candidatus Udaeobacter sp.]
MKMRLAFTGAILCCVSIVRGDEQLFGFVRGAETLPAHRWKVYQFVTLGEGKSEGTYYGTHFETEAEYGFTNQFQASLSLIQHYFYNKGVDGAPQSSKRLDFSECVRRFNHHRLRPLSFQWRKPACVDELDSSRCRRGVADFAVDPHLSGKEDTPYGSILNEVTLCVSGRRGSTAKSHYSESQRGS